MTSLIELMDEMADKIRAACDTALAATDFSVQVEPRMIFNPTPPAVDIYPGDPPTDLIGAGFGDLSGRELFTVRARIDTGDSIAGQEWLLALMDDDDPLSVAAALMDDQTLNGLASSVDVVTRTGYRQYIDPGGEGALLGCEWTVAIVNTYS